ncbi:CDP-glycerol glycerophosphotransferase family protein [Halomicrobium salinisoli]|uniref:CDP-glycerol glycerophosphotransferase family protein n=1 Tax=Halomicrobium salinisoli TaxID=2878391 RepID=UPI001CF078AD|nr:CDP-glycerol glycerophosphotransferase family protein [Halomicrobium salinisoli]
MSPGLTSALRTLAGAAGSFAAHRAAHLVPRDDDLWAFGCRGGERFEGNAKYLFLQVAERDDLDVRPVWLSESDETVAALREHEYEAYRTDTTEGLRTLARAGRVFTTGGFTGLPLWPTGGAEVVQLWHGVPLKRISADGPQFERASPFERLSRRYVYQQFDRVAVTGRRFVDVFRSAFEIDADRVSVTGYPRNDALFREVPGFDVGQDRALHDAVAALDGPVFAYLPTYREDGTAPADAVDFAALDGFLADRDAHLLVKFHPFEDRDVDAAALDRVRVLPPDFDVYPALRHVDALVTDYSSVFFDYLLLDRPVIFYAYDRDAYEAESGLYFDYEAATPGPIADDFDELLAALDDCAAGIDGHADARETVRNAVFDDVDGRSAARVVDLVTDDALEPPDTRTRDTPIDDAPRERAPEP